MSVDMNKYADLVDMTERLSRENHNLRKALKITPDECGRIMHESWCQTKRAQGFVHPDEVNDRAEKMGLVSSARVHPDLVPWERLPKAQQDIGTYIPAFCIEVEARRFRADVKVRSVVCKMRLTA